MIDRRDDGTVGLELDDVAAAALRLEADHIADDVQRNHVGHMRECTGCTWWYCAHYPCGCASIHDALGNPIAVGS